VERKKVKTKTKKGQTFLTKDITACGLQRSVCSKRLKAKEKAKIIARH